MLATPASATLAGALLISVTSSKVLAHTPLLIVHRNTVGAPPAVTPVTVLVAEDGVVIAPGPLMSVHKPVPGDAALPDSVKLLVLHKVWSEPAFDTGAGAVFVKTMSSKVVGQVPLPTVHLKVALVPAAMPVIVVVAEVAFVIVADPL